MTTRSYIPALSTALVFLLFSCREDGAGLLTPDGGDTESPSGWETETSANGHGTDSSGEETFPKPCADIYDESLLPTFEVEMDETEWRAMENDCRNYVQEYRPIVFRYEGESASAMMRLKGNWSWNCDKMQFVVSFNETDSNGRFHGLRKIVLDAPWYDPTLVHERLAFYYLKQYGMPYSCVNNARLYVNGQYYGIYVNVERLDREYLERHYALPDGNLYKEGRELKTNEDWADTSRNDAFWAAEDVQALENLVDLDHAVRLWAGLAMAPDPDSYWAGVEINFYLYDHPTRGFLYLPYDMDIAFAENLWPSLEEVDPITFEHEDWLREPQYETVMSDEGWCNAFVDALTDARAAYDPTALANKLALWSTQIEDAVDADPNKTFTMAERGSALDELHTFFDRRAAFVDRWLEGGRHCPPEWPAHPANW